MEIKCFKQSWQPVAKKQTFWKCLSALTQLWQDFSLTCGAPLRPRKKRPKNKKEKQLFHNVPFWTKWQELSNCLPWSKMLETISDGCEWNGQRALSSVGNTIFVVNTTLKLCFLRQRSANNVYFNTFLFNKWGFNWLVNASSQMYIV